MRVLQISNYFYPHIGGIEQVARDICNSLECEQKVICFNSEKNDVVETIDGVEITYVGTFAKVASQSLSNHYGKSLKKMFSSFEPDIVIFHYPNPFVALYLLKILKKYPNTKLILYWHLDIVKQKILKIFFKGQNRKLLERAYKIVATSPNYVEGSEWLSKYKNKCVVIPNCVSDSKLELNTEIDEKAKEIKDMSKDKIICFAAGRHVPYKGIEYLVKASKYLDDSYEIRIAGQGPLTEELKEMAKDDKKIKFLGKISDSDLKSNLLACDIFCFPSITKNEAFGIALAEAMFYSKPSVTFTIDGSGVNYVSINKETCIEVENSNSEEFANAIKQLSFDKELREQYGKNAKKRAEDNFTFSAFKRNIQNLVSDI
ncbi:MAG: glycosyltransferase [Clostridia bacterium]|nr:glycosyltransferase [Clostridia bacterium]